MAIIVDIYYYDIDAYTDYIGEETAENMSRKGFGGLAAHDSKDGSLSGALIWQQRNEENGSTDAELTFYHTSQYETGIQLLSEFFEREREAGTDTSRFELPGLSEEMKKTLRDSGFSLKEKESRDLYITVGEIADHRAFKSKRIPRYIVPLKMLDAARFERGIARALFAGLKGTESDLSTIHMDWFEQDISCCLVTDDRVTGMVLIHGCADGVLMPVLLYTSGVEGPKELGMMLRYSVQEALYKYGKDTPVRIRRHDGKSLRLANHLFPGKTGETVTAGIRKR